MVFGFSGVFMVPKTDDLQLWRHQDTPTSSRKLNYLLTICLGNIPISEIDTFQNVGKDEGNLEDPFSAFENLEYGSNIYQNMERKFGNMAPISIKKS